MGSYKVSLAMNLDDLGRIEVGSYKVSLAMNLDDLGRIDETVLQVQPQIARLLRAHYGEGYGFAICMFQKTLKAHPIAFICNG